MTEKFSKDLWIKEALAARYLIAREDGTILRLKKIEDKRRHYVRQTYSTHAKTGRVYFQLKFRGVTKSVLVNRVIGLAFLPNPDNLPEVNHIDGDKAHNWKTNLEWSTRSEQEKHAFASGLKSSRGTQNANARLTPADVKKIREAPEASLSEIAITLKVSLKCVQDVRARRTWRHV